MDEVGEKVVAEITRSHWYSGFPRWLKAILLILSIVTMVYWLCYITIKILSAIRVVGSYFFQKEHYWMFLGCILILIVGGLLLGQFYFELNPFGKALDWVIDFWEGLRNDIAGMIKG